MPIIKANHKVLYFAHVPFASPTSVTSYLADRFGPLSFFGKKPQARDWGKTSPQNITANELLRLFSQGFFDSGFAVVRNPITRYIDTFRHHRAKIKSQHSSCGLDEWAQRLSSLGPDDHAEYDNHFLPQSALVPDWCDRIPAETYHTRLPSWLDQATETVSPLVLNPAEAPVRRELRPDTLSSLATFYAEDFDLCPNHKDTSNQRAALFAATRPADLPAPLASSNKVRDIGVFIHAYYEDLLPQILKRISMISAPKRIYISTTDENKAHRIADMAGGAETRVFKNRGRDIWGKVWGFSDKYREHDVVLHVHTKKSPHDKRLGGWLDHALEAMIPDDCARIVAALVGQTAVGMVAPAISDETQLHCTWRKNFQHAKALASRMNIPLENSEDFIRFPAGSMFWARSSILAPLVDLSLPQDYFPEETGVIDGTPAHAVERLFGVLCETAGYELVYLD